MGEAFASVVLLLPIISAWVSCGPSVSTIMPVRLFICMSSPLFFGVCAFPFNVVSNYGMCRSSIVLVQSVVWGLFWVTRGSACFVVSMFCVDSFCGCVVLCVTTSAHEAWDYIFWVFICRRFGHSWYWQPISLHP